MVYLPPPSKYTLLLKTAGVLVPEETALLPLPDLSFHCVMFDPDRTMLVVSAPSNHKDNPEIPEFVGVRRVSAILATLIVVKFDIANPLISTFVIARYVAQAVASPLPPPPPPAGPVGPIAPVGPVDPAPVGPVDPAPVGPVDPAVPAGPVLPAPAVMM